MDEPNERALEQGLLEGTPYRVIGRLGAEPGGERLEVEHVKLRKRFTLLALRAPEPRFDRVERLLRELRELARLAHPNIDLPADAGTTKDGVTYLVTSPERGETLAARLARGPLGTIAALGVAADVASALGAAHAAGVAHRGVLPSRILLGPRGARLTGFGLARLTASSNELAGSGARGDLVAVGRLLVEHAAADPELAALTAALVGPAPAGRALDGRSVALTLRRLAARLRGGVLDDAPTRAIRYDALTAAEQTLVDPPESAPPAADDDRTHPDGVARDERTIIDGPRAGTGVAARSAERASEVAAPAEVPSARSAPATSRPRAERVRRRYAAPFLTFCAGFGAALGLSTTLALARWLAPSAATPTVAALDAAPLRARPSASALPASRAPAPARPASASPSAALAAAPSPSAPAGEPRAAAERATQVRPTGSPVPNPRPLAPGARARSRRAPPAHRKPPAQRRAHTPPLCRPAPPAASDALELPPPPDF